MFSRFLPFKLEDSHIVRNVISNLYLKIIIIIRKYNNKKIYENESCKLM